MYGCVRFRSPDPGNEVACADERRGASLSVEARSEPPEVSKVCQRQEFRIPPLYTPGGGLFRRFELPAQVDVNRVKAETGRHTC